MLQIFRFKSESGAVPTETLSNWIRMVVRQGPILACSHSVEGQYKVIKLYVEVHK